MYRTGIHHEHHLWTGVQGLDLAGESANGSDGILKALTAQFWFSRRLFDR